jgi:hypothetical protein
MNAGILAEQAAAKSTFDSILKAHFGPRTTAYILPIGNCRKTQRTPTGGVNFDRLPFRHGVLTTRVKRQGGSDGQMGCIEIRIALFEPLIIRVRVVLPIKMPGLQPRFKLSQLGAQSGAPLTKLGVARGHFVGGRVRNVLAIGLESIAKVLLGCRDGLKCWAAKSRMTAGRQLPQSSIRHVW